MAPIKLTSILSSALYCYRLLLLLWVVIGRHNDGKNVWHVAMTLKSIPIFPPELCFCDNPENRNNQVALADPESNNTDYLDEDSDSIEHEEDNFVEHDSAHSNDTHVHCFREFRHM